MDDLLCIVCPRGCRLRAIPDANGSCRIEGARCQRGRDYGAQEAVAPQRVLTTTLATVWGRPLPVRSSRPVDRQVLLPLQRLLARLVVDHAVQAGDVLLANLDGQGAALVASADATPGPMPSP